MNDDDLMHLWQEGQQEAFEALFGRHHGAVYRLALILLRQEDAAQEVLQDTFVALAQHHQNYAPQGQFRCWLLRMARNLCLNRLRAQRLRRAVLAGSDLALQEVPAKQVEPDAAACANEQLAVIQAALAQLPEAQREALALFAFEQMGYRQIAELTGSPINTVKTHIRRARLALARRLGEGRQE